MNRPFTADAAELRAQNLSYEINDKLILNDLNFNVQAGEVLFIEGDNGSGKTTLIRLLCGLSQADAGQLSWNGEDIAEARLDYCRQLTYIGHATGVKPELTAVENLQFFSALSAAATDRSYEDAIAWVGLQGAENSPGRHLSYGQQRRIALARLQLEASLLWVLDEPFSGLDKAMIKKLEVRFAEHTRGGGILVLSSHQPVNLSAVNSKRIQLQAGNHVL